MRSRLFEVAVAALLGANGLAVAQQPAVPVVPMPVPAAPAALQPPPGMVPVPVAPPVGYAPVAAAPVVGHAQPGCLASAAPAPVGCAAGDCGGGGGKAKNSLFDRLFAGTASPVGCGCLASERTFLFGSCRQFYTPGRTCGGVGIAYGCGGGECGHGPKDPCRHVTSFINR
jgi:hypothetical protein